MIDLLTIQETSRNGFPPAVEEGVKSGPVNGREFSDYLAEQDSMRSDIVSESMEKSPKNVSDTRTGKVDTGGNPEDTRGSEIPDGKSEKSDPRIDTESGGRREAGDVKKRGGSPEKTGKNRPDKGESAAENMKSLDKQLQGRFSGRSEKISADDFSFGKTVETDKLNISPVEKGEEESSVSLSGGKEPREPSAESRGAIVNGSEGGKSAEILAAVAAAENGGLLPEKTGMKGTESSKPLTDGRILKDVGGEPDKSGLKIELSDQRKVIKSPVSGDLKGLKAGAYSSGEVHAASGIESTDVSFEAGAGESGDDGTEVPFRVVEVGPSSVKEGNVDTLSVNRNELAGSFKNILQEKGIPGIVKQTGILLKDNNQGELRLVLRPESLGKVRIRLNLNENNIAGRIFVENINVKDTFNSTLEELQKAFRDSGFDAANLEVFVQGEGAGESRERDDRPVMVHPSVIETIEENIPLAESFMDEDARVNLLA